MDSRLTANKLRCIKNEFIHYMKKIEIKEFWKHFPFNMLILFSTLYLYYREKILNLVKPVGDVIKI